MQAGFVTVDVHGKTKVQAKATIEAVLRKCGPSVYRVRVIHGFNNGTELRDMLQTEYAGKHARVKRILRTTNPGITELVLREL